LKAIEEFTELGAGFKIALRDLEIRGAGNILGPEQSGHIESVGYELYCSLLESAVRSLTSQPAGPSFDCSIELAWRAYLPKDFVPGPRVKVELYRRLGRVRSLERVADFRQELIDRFGALPGPAENLMVEAELRVLAERWQLARIHVEDEYAVLTYRNACRIEKLAALNPGKVRVVDEKTAYVPLEEKKPHGSVVVGIVRPILQATDAPVTPTAAPSPPSRRPAAPRGPSARSIDPPAHPVEDRPPARVGTLGERLKARKGRG
jgi:transcription-repair coupling factor (superfamily II helicase)